MSIFKKRNTIKIDKPQGIEKVTQEPLIDSIKFDSLQEAMDFIINKLGNLTEKKQVWRFILSIAKSRNRTKKIKAYIFIAKYSYMLNISKDKIQEIKNIIILELKELKAVKALGELKAVKILKDIQWTSNDKVTKAAVKELGKLKEVRILKKMGKFSSYSKGVTKTIMKELRKLKAVNALEDLVKIKPSNDLVTKTARKELKRLKIYKNKILIEKLQEIINNLNK